MKALAFLAVIGFLVYLVNGDFTIPIVRRPLDRTVLRSELLSYGQTKTRNKVPLFGNITQTGEFFVPIQIGTPRRTYYVQVDTGSSQLAIPSIDCLQNCDSEARYDPDLSTTSNPIECREISCESCGSKGECEFSVNFIDGNSFTAQVYSDVVQLGDQTVDSQYFGAIITQTANFQTPPVVGVLGLNFGASGSLGQNNFFESLVAAGKIHNSFSICLASDGGQLNLGRRGDNHDHSFLYTPLVRDNVLSVYLQDVSVNGQSVGVDSKVYNEPEGAYVDTGATFLFLPAQAYDGLRSVLVNLCDAGLPLVGMCNVTNNVTLFENGCFSIGEEDFEQYPNIDFAFGQDPNHVLVVSIKPKQYLQKGLCDDATQYALAIGSSGSNAAILGDSFLQAFETDFDIKNGRIGFAAVDGCPRNSSAFLTPLFALLSLALLLVL